MIPFAIFQTISEAIAYQVGILHEASIDTQYDNIGTYPISWFLHDNLAVPRVARADSNAEANCIAAMDTHDYADSLPSIVSNKFQGIISAMNTDIKTGYTDINAYLQASTYDVHRNFAYAWYRVTGEHIHANNVYCGLNNWAAVAGPPIRPVAQSIAGGYAEGYNDWARVNAFFDIGIGQIVGFGHFIFGGPFTDGCRIGTGATGTEPYQIYVVGADPIANYGNANMRLVRDVGVANWTLDVDYVQEDGTTGTQVGIVLAAADIQLANPAVDITDIRETGGGAVLNRCHIEISDTVGAVAIIIEQ